LNTETTAVNTQVDQWLRTSPAAILFFLGKVLRGLLDAGWAMIAGTFGVIQTGHSEKLLIAAGIFLVVMAAWSILSWMRFRYRLDGDRMLVKRGVFQREQLTIEFGKVQKVRVLEPFYLRPFRLALLKVDTAGSAKQEVTLGGVALKLAHALRDNIVSRQNQDTEPVAGQTDEDAASSSANAHSTIMLSRNNKDIALYGLTHNGMLWVAAVVGAIFSQASQSDSWDIFKNIAGLFNFQFWSNLQIGLAILAVMALLPLLSIVGSFWRHYRYTLFRDGETWRRHSGLVSKHDESIKQHKIQSVIWHQNFVAKALGRINLKLKQASAGVAMGADSAQVSRNPSFLVPALHPHEAEQLTQQLLPQAQTLNTEFSKVHRKYVRKILLWGWSWPPALALISPSILWDWRAALLWPVIMLIGWLIVNRMWHQFGYSVRGDYGFIRSGFIGSKISVFPLFKVQRVDIRQSPSQRRHHLAHLHIHLASHSLTLPWIKLEDAQLFRDIALFHVETSRKSWF